MEDEELDHCFECLVKRIRTKQELKQTSSFIDTLEYQEMELNENKYKNLKFAVQSG